jgi:hypothetical protein
MSRLILQAMPIGITGFESRRVASVQKLLSIVRYKHDLTEKHVHKLIRSRMPMSLARPSARRQP